MRVFEMPQARALLLALPLAGVGCTFTGLGDYDVETCVKPLGTTTVVQPVGALGANSDLTFAPGNGVSPLGAFATQVQAGSCVQSVGPSGYLEPGCAFFGEHPLSPRQPWIAALGGGYAAAVVATTAPCTVGQLSFQYLQPGVLGTTQVACDPDAGVALPSFVPLPGGAGALVAWYAAPFATLSDPDQTCAGATAAPLVATIVAQAATANPIVGAPVTLTAQGISVRPPAMAALPGQPQVLVAAPDGNDVSVWTLDGSLSPGSPQSIPGLAGARAVSIAVAPDGRIAVVAEIGCAPQSLALAVGTLAGGFGRAVVVAPAGADRAVKPTVAWVASQNDWMVGWISTHGGVHALARRFDASGDPVGETLDPSLSVTGACVAADGSLFGYAPGQGGGSFVTTSLGCAE